jgi:hypothetical protein
MSVETPVQALRTFFHASFANNSTLTKWPSPKIENPFPDPSSLQALPNLPIILRADCFGRTRGAA